MTDNKCYVWVLNLTNCYSVSSESTVELANEVENELSYSDVGSYFKLLDKDDNLHVSLNEFFNNQVSGFLTFSFNF